MTSESVGVEPNRQELVEIISALAVDVQVQEKAEGMVRKKLGRFLKHSNESLQIGQDALMEVSGNLISNMVSGKDLPESAALWPQAGAAYKGNHPAIAYLLAGVSNYLQKRLDDWSSNNRKGQPGSRQRKLAPSDSDRDNWFWDLVSVQAPVDNRLDRVDSALVILQSNGVREQDLAIIRAKLEGTTYEEMAGRWGGTEGKYRKIVARALEKVEAEAVNPRHA